MDFVRLFQNIHDPLAKKGNKEIEKFKQIITEKDAIIENNEQKINELQNTIAELQGEDYSKKTELNNEMYDILMKYEKMISSTLVSFETEKQEKLTAQNHLARLETAFHDLVQKYERAKEIITGFQENEATLVKHIEEFEENIEKLNDKYLQFKAYAIEKINEANKTIGLKDKEHTETLSHLEEELRNANDKTKFLEGEVIKITEKSKSYSIFQPLVTNFK